MSPPICPDGHGAMDRIEGYWAFDGVDRVKGTLLTGDTFSRNGKGCVVKLWTCPVCKLVRAYADDSEE